MVHHTAPHIPFKAAEDWDGAAAQLGGTVHCDYPKWCALFVSVKFLAVSEATTSTVRKAVSDSHLLEMLCNKGCYGHSSGRTYPFALVIGTMSPVRLNTRVKSFFAFFRVEVLCHDINVHIPHHISQRIPWYNLRKATDSLRTNWGPVSIFLSLFANP